MYTVQTLKYTSFELERFGNDCSAKVIAKNQVKKVINFFLQTIIRKWVPYACAKWFIWKGGCSATYSYQEWLIKRSTLMLDSWNVIHEMQLKSESNNTNIIFQSSRDAFSYTPLLHIPFDHDVSAIVIGKAVMNVYTSTRSHFGLHFTSYGLRYDDKLLIQSLRILMNATSSGSIRNYDV